VRLPKRFLRVVQARILAKAIGSIYLCSCSVCETVIRGEHPSAATTDTIRFSDVASKGGVYVTADRPVQGRAILQTHGKEARSSGPQEVQELYGYLPREVPGRPGDESTVEPNLRVVTFYAQFYLTPGQAHDQVCRGTACHVRGGRSVLNAVKDCLGVEDGETTAICVLVGDGGVPGHLLSGL
jgi:hypothetical protein